MGKSPLRRGQAPVAADHSSSSCKSASPKVNQGKEVMHRDHPFHLDGKGISL